MAQENPVCVLESLIKGRGINCDKELLEIKDLKVTVTGSLLNNLRKFFSGFPGFTLPQNGLVCSSCLEYFGKRQGRLCKHPQHPASLKNIPIKNFYFLTAVDFFDKFYELGYSPNDAICKRNCLKLLRAEIQGKNETIINEVDSEENEEDSPFLPPPLKTGILQMLNRVIERIPGIQPIALGKRNVKGQSIMVDEKITEIQGTLRSKVEELGLSLPKDVKDEEVQVWKKDSKDLISLMSMVKHRLIGCSKAEQRSLLTLCPGSWTIDRAAKYFGVSKMLIRSSRKQKSESGSVLPPIKTKIGKKLNSETKNKVKEFYYEADVSRICPGAKDFLSVKDLNTGRRQLKQKRYLLCNLKELYQIFKTQNPTLKIGISSFIALRPVECFSLTTKGYHAVCLCIYHENCNLLCNSIGMNSSKKFVETLVCDKKKKDCMYRRCENCMNNSNILKADIGTILDISAKTIIRYRRWLSTDGTKFVCEEKTRDEFLEFIVDSLEALLKHEYITHAQNQYQRFRKLNLKSGEIICCGDFAENYTPVIQNAIQSEYFCQHLKQITVHPFNIYMNFDNHLFSFAFVVISDCNTHDTNSFFVFQRALINELKKQIADVQSILGIPLPDINNIIYFSDGCAAQYKNRKNFCNLYFHNVDFRISAEWNFFATAHGKGPCDGHGGTTKRLAKIASERGEIIQTAKELYTFCKKNITGIEYLLVTENEIHSVVEEYALVERYEKVQSIQGTRQAHRIIAVEDKIVLYETSNDEEPLTSKIVHGVNELPQVLIDESSVNDWIACVYDSEWYIAVIDEVNIEDEEVLVSFYKGTKKGRSETFVPEGKNTGCWIQFGRILKKIAPPKASRGGRTISVSTVLQEELDRLLQVFLK